MSMGIYFIMMKDFDELEQLFERYNYRQMDKQQLYELIKMPLFDRKVFEHFFMYEVYRDVMCNEQGSVSCFIAANCNKTQDLTRNN